MIPPPASPWPPLSELLGDVGTGALSASELVGEALACAREHQGLNAFAVLHARASRQRARELDSHFATAGTLVGPLHGVPIAIKDNLDEAGVTSAAGCAAYADRVPAADAQVVARLRQAGAVILGRTNLHELADGVTSANPWRGPVLHPLRPDHHPGGSSGGSAVAVAAGCVPVALGTDTGGSVRIPASLCGVVGWKPSHGRIPTAGGIPLSTTLDHVGILGPSVADVALVFGALADPAAPTEGRSGGAEWGRSGDVERGRPLRLGLLPGSAFGLEPDLEVAARLDEALARLRAAGHEVVPVWVDGLERGVALLSAIYPPEAAAWHRQRLESCPEQFGEEVLRDLRRGLRPGAEDRRHAALGEAAALASRLDACFEGEGLDFVLSATTPHPARPHGAPSPHTYLTYTCCFNLTGLPALSVPMGLAAGLPVGLQLVGRAGEDERLLALAAELPIGPEASPGRRGARGARVSPAEPSPTTARPGRGCRLAPGGRQVVKLRPRRRRGASPKPPGHTSG